MSLYCSRGWYVFYMWSFEPGMILPAEWWTRKQVSRQHCNNYKPRFFSASTCECSLCFCGSPASNLVWGKKALPAIKYGSFTCESDWNDWYIIQRRQLSTCTASQEFLQILLRDVEDKKNAEHANEIPLIICS